METPEIVPAPTDTVAETETKDSSIIRQMREQIESANRAKKEAEKQAQDIAAKLRAREDLELSEIDRLKREVDELKPLRDSHGKFSTRMESLYMEEISSVPEEKREAVERLSASGDWADRLEAIKAAKVLLGSPAAPQAPQPPKPMGTAAAPARPPVTPQAERHDPTKLSWSDALKLTRNP